MQGGQGSKSDDSYRDGDSGPRDPCDFPHLAGGIIVFDYDLCFLISKFQFVDYDIFFYRSPMHVLQPATMLAGGSKHAAHVPPQDCTACDACLQPAFACLLFT